MSGEQLTPADIWQTLDQKEKEACRLLFDSTNWRGLNWKQVATERGYLEQLWIRKEFIDSLVDKGVWELKKTSEIDEEWIKEAESLKEKQRQGEILNEREKKILSSYPIRKMTLAQRQSRQISDPPVCRFASEDFFNLAKSEFGE